MILDHNRKRRIAFPIGYHRFHKDQLFNYQLNRWHSLGFARYEDMKRAGEKIKTFEDWKAEMIGLAEEAESEGRLINAAFYYRAAEFYTLPGESGKEKLYDKFIDLFYTAFRDDNIEKYRVPYGESFLPALKVPSASDSPKGVIVMHGGFDSFIEEFYYWMRYFSNHGYAVIAFEGPGQGAALRKNGLTLDYRWEKPTGAVLDYFGLTDVTLLGISMGGYFCIRAAAFEPRIKRVIASGIAYDYSRFPNFFERLIMNLFFRHFRNFTNRMTLKKMKKDGMHAWSIGNLMYITGAKTPMEAADVAFEMNAGNLHSEKVKQDVLILTGREDHFIPFKMHDKQVRALTNARSVTARIFTRRGHAHNHCQIGNIALALDTMIGWLEEKS